MRDDEYSAKQDVALIYAIMVKNKEKQVHIADRTVVYTCFFDIC